MVVINYVITGENLSYIFAPLTLKRLSMTSAGGTTPREDCTLKYWVTASINVFSHVCPFIISVPLSVQIICASTDSIVPFLNNCKYESEGSFFLRDRVSNDAIKVMPKAISARTGDR